MNDLFCVVSQDAPESIITKLNGIFGDVIELPPDNDLAPPVQCHPDMIFTVVCGKMFLSKKYYDINCDIVNHISTLGGWELVLSEGPRGQKYPNDVAFNVALTRDINGQPCLLGHENAVNPQLIEWAKMNGINFIPQKQGYAGCSCLTTDAGVLTFDRGISVTLERNHIPHVCLKNGGISLPGYNEGFLGGASGFFENTIYILGNADTLPCSEELKQFALSSEYKVCSVSMDNVIDCGGLKIYRKSNGEIQ